MGADMSAPTERDSSGRETRASFQNYASSNQGRSDRQHRPGAYNQRRDAAAAGGADGPSPCEMILCILLLLWRILLLLWKCCAAVWKRCTAPPERAEFMKLPERARRDAAYRDDVYGDGAYREDADWKNLSWARRLEIARGCRDKMVAEQQVAERVLARDGAEKQHAWSLAWAHMHKIKISNNGSVATDVAVNPTHGDDQRGRYRVVLGNEGFATGKHEFFIKLLKPARFLIGVVTEEITPEWREGLIETSCFREGRRRQTRERDLRGCKSLAQVRQAFTVCPPSNCSPNMAR